MLNSICVTKSGRTKQNQKLKESGGEGMDGCGTRTCTIHWLWPCVKTYTLSVWLDKSLGPSLESEDADLKILAGVGQR